MTSQIELFVNRLKIGQIQGLVRKFNLSPKYTVKVRNRIVQTKTLVKYLSKHRLQECPICFEKIKYINAIMTDCLHIFCYRCLLMHLKNNSTCPMCREYMQYEEIMRQITDHTEYRNCRDQLNREMSILDDRDILDTNILTIEPEINNNNYIFHPLQFIYTINLCVYIHIINIFFIIYLFYEIIRMLHEQLHPQLDNYFM
jgi:hypothetical protein